MRSWSAIAVPLVQNKRNSRVTSGRMHLATDVNGMEFVRFIIQCVCTLRVS